MITGDSEFIKNRSFEIAWAVFRCATLVKQSALKTGLENTSVGLVAGFGDVNSLEKLEQLIRLAEAVGEISKTNALVLFREMDNLREIIRQWNSAIQQEKEESSAIDRIFVKVPVSLFDINNSSAHSADSGQAKLSAGSSAILKPVNSAKEIRQENNSAKVITNNSANSAGSAKVRQNTDDFMSEDRQKGVFKKVQELGKTTTKELSGFFPDVSERTIRFYLQGLCEQGLVSRVGTTGPGSYYVVR